MAGQWVGLKADMKVARKVGQMVLLKAEKKVEK